MITAELLGGDKVVAFMSSLPEKSLKAITEDVSRLALLLLRHVKEDKLSGQVLNVRTGTLRRAINQKVDASSQEIVGQVGVKLAYAAIHEFGGTIQRSMREAKLRFRLDSKGGLMKQGKAGKLLVFAKDSHKRVATKLVKVKAHEIKMPERSFLRSALADMAPDIRQGLAEAINKGLKA